MSFLLRQSNEIGQALKSCICFFSKDSVGGVGGGQHVDFKIFAVCIQIFADSLWGGNVRNVN